MNKIIVLSVFVLISIIGCTEYTKTAPQYHTYKILVLPSDNEGKKCAIECKKTQLRQEQLSKAKNSVPGGRESGTDMSALDKQKIDIDYEKCVIGCGATYEIRRKWLMINQDM